MDIMAPDVILKKRKDEFFKKQWMHLLITQFGMAMQLTQQWDKLIDDLLKSLSDYLKSQSKDISVRTCLGKRVDYSGRSVIIIGPELASRSVWSSKAYGS